MSKILSSTDDWFEANKIVVILLFFWKIMCVYLCTYSIRVFTHLYVFSF